MNSEPENPSQMRRAHNEALFKDHNHRIRHQVETVIPEENRKVYAIGFVCECSDLNCHDTIPLTLDQFKRWSKDPKHFILKPQHHQPDIERVIESGAGYEVVEKFQPPPA